MISMRGLTFTYSGAVLPALKNVDLDIDDGEFLLVTGPSGCGKSSLCRCLNGLIPHFYGGEVRGSVEVHGRDVLRTPTREMAAVVGMVFQDPENQLVAMDVEREIAFGLENLAFPRQVIVKRIEEALDTLGISHLRRRQVHQLSGGEKQKVAIASVLALHPHVLVLDEPTSELDPRGAEEVLSIVQRLNDELGTTVVLVEHRLERVVHLVDRMVVLNEGSVIADGRPRGVLELDELARIGVGLPPMVRLVKGLRKKGLAIDSIPLTVKEGRVMLDGYFRHAQKDSPGEEPTPTLRPIVDVEKLWYAYADGPTALRDVSLTMSEGQFVAIMGRNASGKTTLVKTINGLLRPTRGRVAVAGADTRKATTAELAHHVGFVFQNPNDHLFADTVEEEIGFILKNLGHAARESASRVEDVLDTFDLRQHRRRYPRSLSGGEKQRVALASVLVARPRVLILDEPTRGMEYRLKSELMRFLQEYRDQGNAVILVTHDVETVAEHADRVVLLSEGTVVVDGTRRDVLSQALLFSPQINRLVQAFARYGVPDKVLTVKEALDLLA